MNERIYLSSPHMGDGELKYIQEAFDQNWIAPLGPNVDNFEKEICKYSGAEHCAVLSSGTAAIHLALIILGVKRGDNVICSSFTFSASANPIVYQGANPVFVDSETNTWNMDPVLLEKAITDQIEKGSKPAAVIFVHLYGMPGKIDEIVNVCKKYDIPLIEDAAEALGSSFKGQKLGTFGDFGIYSFNGNKIITTSGGGALVSNNEVWIKKARFLATQARDQAPHYQHSEIGYNYRMSNIAAGIGRGQLQVLDNWVEKRRANYYFYKQNLKDKGFTFIEEPTDDYFSNRWLTTVLIDKTITGFDREVLRTELEKYNIETRPLWKPMHMQPVFEMYKNYGGAVGEKLFESGLCLPSGSNLTTEQKELIINKINAFS
ncbi:DegT/DnrJ/EryC1/StrS family aminotransferase [Fulvivirga lutimaris]|uniref:DegT/DnrJ/EryC1/StrS family aminotransferase n=1 Tax=Fulvivirga lutimaris TaxID=1819566 RepID=UPI0012BCF35D|nr:aminotransferase class I/II-fold pyridoxal phosphate-dependent enzyme [Fulvivirga lutimaris]MTI38859.1 aminotransferase class I/II-fold pyridoxal phosphate-dependent enzyme [Fulvivirga lutimaris]